MRLFHAIQMSLFGKPEAIVASHQPQVIPETNLKIPEQSIKIQKTKVATSNNALNLNSQFNQLLIEISSAIDEFKTYDIDRILISMSTSRSRGKTGIWAYVTPLRYVGGSLYRKGTRRGFPGRYTYVLGNTNFEDPTSPLYVMTILVPRFFHLSFRERIETLVHELYHFHPLFRGDLRRFPKPHIHHGPTPKAYQKKVIELTDEALKKKPELAQHALLIEDENHFSKIKRKKCLRPKHHFIPKIFSLFFIIFSSFNVMSQDENWPPRPTLGDEQKLGRDWKWPWEKEGASTDLNILPPLSGEFLEFDENNKLIDGPRYIVSPTETTKLRGAPSERSSVIKDAKPGENYHAYTIDKSGEWVFLRTRTAQGWVPLKLVKVTGQIQASPVLNIEKLQTDTLANQRIEAKIIGKGPEVNDSNLLNFDGDLDKVLTIKSGPLYEQPDPLSIRYGQLQEGDSVSILKRDVTGKWAYVRLLLTGSEGWYPADWLRISRGYKVEGAGKGSLALDLDGVYGASGRNLGLGLGIAYDLLGAKNARDNRFEMGLFYNYFKGETLSKTGNTSNENYTLDSNYSLYGLMGRFIGFAPEGLLGGAIELGLSYQITSLKVTGLSDEVLAASGLLKGKKSKLGVMGGLRGIVSFNSFMQANALFRVNLASGATFYWTGVGLSFRFF